MWKSSGANVEPLLELCIEENSAFGGYCGIVLNEMGSGTPLNFIKSSGPW